MQEVFHNKCKEYAASLLSNVSVSKSLLVVHKGIIRDYHLALLFTSNKTNTANQNKIHHSLAISDTSSIPPIVWSTFNRVIWTLWGSKKSWEYLSMAFFTKKEIGEVALIWELMQIYSWQDPGNIVSHGWWDHLIISPLSSIVQIPSIYN